MPYGPLFMTKTTDIDITPEAIIEGTVMMDIIKDEEIPSSKAAVALFLIMAANIFGDDCRISILGGAGFSVSDLDDLFDSETIH